MNVGSEPPLPAPAVSLVVSRLLAIRQRWFDVCVGRCEGVNVVPVLRESGEIWFLASLGDNGGRKICAVRRDLVGFADHATRAYQYLSVAAYLRSAGYIYQGDEGRYVDDLKSAMVGPEVAEISFFLGRYAEESRIEPALTYDIALFLVGDAGEPGPIISSREGHFAMVSALDATSDFLSVYGVFLQSAVAPLLYGLSMLQVAISFEHRAEAERIRTAMADRALIATAPGGE